MGGAIPLGRKSGRRHVRLQQQEIDESILSRVTELAKRMPRQLRKAFKRLDQDDDGKISYAEFRRGLCNMKLDLSEAELQRLILHCDANSDGCIDFNEFVAVFGSGDAKATAAAQRPLKLAPVCLVSSMRFGYYRFSLIAWGMLVSLSVVQEEESVLNTVRDKVAGQPRKLEQMLQALDDTSTGAVKPHILRAGLTAVGAGACFASLREQG